MYVMSYDQYIYSDLAKILQNPLPGICVVPTEDDITKVLYNRYLVYKDFDALEIHV